MTQQIDRSKLRENFKKLRQDLSHQKRCLFNQQIQNNLLKTKIFQKSINIAFYIPTHNEVDVLPLVEIAWQQKKNCYFPILQETENNQKTGFLLFGLCNQHTLLRKNKYGISEPTLNTPQIEANKLDLVIVPVVGFDKNNNRLGFGSGYYDRTFAFKKQLLQSTKPYLIGVAYDFQRFENLPTKDWDVKMDLIITNCES